MRRWRALAPYLLPALMDLVLALVLFVGTVRATQLTADATRPACVLAVWSLVYVMTCPILGRLVTPARAARFVFQGALLGAIACGLLALATSFLQMLVWVGLVGIAAALVFPAFQTLMRDLDLDAGPSVAHSVGMYTFAWSSGFACGPFASGFLMQGNLVRGLPGWRLSFLFGAAVCLLMTGVLALAVRGRRRESAGASAAPAPVMAPGTGMPDLAWLGWLGAGAGFVALSILRANFPARALGPSCQLTAGMLGTVFFVLNITQALVGLALRRSRTWMYRPLPVALAALSGLGGLLCFGLGTQPPVFLVGAALFGVYSGSFCFYLVFHALVHPSRAARHVAINEAMVGLTGFVAPLAGGLLADYVGARSPYLAAAALTVVVTSIQVVVHRAHAEKLSAIREQAS